MSVRRNPRAAFAVDRSALLASIATVLLALPTRVVAQSPAAYARDAPSAARVDSVFAGFDRRDAPGCALAVLRAGTTVYTRGYGMADLEHDVPITAGTTFYLASVSKQFTAYSVILLARDGRLSLDDDVRKFIPEVPDFRSSYGRPITIRQLLYHTSGLRDYFSVLALDGWPGDGPLTERDFLRLVSRQRTLNFAPGAQHLYSNTGYVLLAVLVKRASGSSLREFAAARIFKPLQMMSTVVRDDHTMLVRGRASAYVPSPTAGWRSSVPGFDVVGDGGIYSTVDDLARWDGNFNVPAAGDREALALLHERGVLTSGDTITYAGGLSHGRFRGLRTVMHGGAYGGYRTSLIRFPEQRVSVAVLCNNGAANAGQLAERVAALYLASEMTPVDVPAVAPAAAIAVAPQPGRRAQYAGLYWNEQSEAWLRITDSAGTLRLAGFGPPVELRRIDSVRFAAPARGLTLTPGDRRVFVRSGDAGPVAYDAVAPARLTAAALGELTGQYSSVEAEATVDVRVRNGRLELSGRRIEPIPLEQLFGETFAGGRMVVRFVRERGAIARLTVSNGRARGVSFQRAESR